MILNDRKDERMALNKKGEDIRACPHPAITIF